MAKKESKTQTFAVIHWSVDDQINAYDLTSLIAQGFKFFQYVNIDADECAMIGTKSKVSQRQAQKLFDKWDRQNKEEDCGVHDLGLEDAICTCPKPANDCH